MESVATSRIADVTEQQQNPEVDTDLRRQWNDLAEQVRHHRDLYYNDQPDIPDADFDALFR